MDAYILETLLATGWRRAGEVYWTLESAIAAGNRLLKLRRAGRIRVLPIKVDLNPVAELPPVKRDESECHHA